MEGAHLILWGLFKKVFVADNVAILVDRVFDQAHPSGFSSLIGAYSFALQLFCDFSGYTDMARGCAKCLGLELSENFRHPYLAVSPSDFWQRWHMTLSTWLRDYVFRSLGGAFRSPLLAYRNLAITMILAGLWHGASWTYIFWGAYWAVLLVGHRVLQPVMKRRGQWFRRYMPKSTRKLVKIVVTAHLVCFGWLVFRAESLTKAWTLAVALLRWQGATDLSLATPLLRFGALYLVMELVFVLLGVGSTRRLSRPLIWLRPVFYALLIYFTAFYGAGSQAFIYAQF